jgi:hypothetical protein
MEHKEHKNAAKDAHAAHRVESATARSDSPNPCALVGSKTLPKADAVVPFRAVTPPPPPQVSNATGRLVGRSLEKELGSLKPWSVGLGVEHCDSPPVSEGGDGESPGPRPPPTP